jgi:hypothetical protein
LVITNNFYKIISGIKQFLHKKNALVLANTVGFAFAFCYLEHVKAVQSVAVFVRVVARY